MNLSNRNALSEILQQISQNLNLPHLALDTDGRCRLTSGDNALPFRIEVDEQQPLVHLIAFIADTPNNLQDRAKLYEDLLVVNSFHNDNCGMTFSINSAAKKIQLQNSHPISHLNASKLEQHLNSFLSKADNLSKSLTH